MRVIADLHLHSKYSRATSKRMTIPEIAKWANYKGINVVGTGDFTHPLWLSEIKKNLEYLGNGFYVLKGAKYPRFVLSAEIALIYSDAGKCRRIHIVLLAPSIEIVEKINKKLSDIGNLYSDGRPILGLSAKKLTEIVMDIDSRCMVIPAHMWTPWFSLFGSKSGFDKLTDCFGEYSKYIYAGETGLSSDPEMNWRLSQLDNITLVSNSDSHSPENLGREANVFEVEDDNYSYNYIYEILCSKNKKYFPFTIEFYPQEGKYHYDGHRNCNETVLKPSDAIKLNNICPVCNKPLTIGVLHRVEELADREEGYIQKKIPDSVHLVPLQEIIAEVFNVNKKSKKVQGEYLKYISVFNNEFSILLDISYDKLRKIINPTVVRGIKNVREGKVNPIAGYDGVYGIIKVLNEKQEEKNDSKQTKSRLF